MNNNENNNMNNQNVGQAFNNGVNQPLNPATQQFQTGVSNNIVQNQEYGQVNNFQSQSNPTVYQQNVNQIDNQQYNNVMPEKLKKYRRILHNDSIALLVISIITMFAGLIFAGIGLSDSSISLFIESLLYFIFLIIIIENIKTTRKFVGVLVIIASSLMILFAIYNHSLFDIIYFILGIVYMIHSIIYLNNFKGYTPIKQVQEKFKIDKLKNISLILIILCFLYPVVSIIIGIFIDSFFFNTTSGVILMLFIFALTSLILNIILIIKKRKSFTLYVCLILSIIVTLFTIIYIPSSIEKLLSEYTDYDSEQDKEFLMYTTEGKINGVVQELLGSCINEPTQNTSEEILIGKELLKSCIDSRNARIKEYKNNPETAELYKNVKEWTNAYEENEKKGYICDGYTVLRRFYSESECIDAGNDSISCMGYNEEYKIGETHSSTFIKCTGRYEYETEGFDEEKLIRSKKS